MEKISNTNDLKRKSQAEFSEENNNIAGFDNPEKSLILSDRKRSLMEVGERSGESLVETKPSEYKQESPAELQAEDKNVTRSDSACKQRKKRSQTSCDPMQKFFVDSLFGLLKEILQYREIMGKDDDVETMRLLQDVSDGTLTKEILHQKLAQHCEQQEKKEKTSPKVDDQEN